MTLPWIEPDEPLPAFAEAPAPDNELPAGLIAAGRDLSPQRLIEAYSRGIFPWYTEGQPVLWWSPDPRMVLTLSELKIQRSLKKTLRRLRADDRFQITINQAFEQVIASCAEPREQQDGTWITDDMVHAYCELHQMGHAQSVEVWQNEPAGRQLVGGLYGVSIGRMFFGESMFARVNDASKIALVCLTHWLNLRGFHMIDCQQNTRHLASFGARETSRCDFLTDLAPLVRAAAPDWQATEIEIPSA